MLKFDFDEATVIITKGIAKYINSQREREKRRY